MRALILGLMTLVSTTALAQADFGEDVFTAVGRRLNMTSGSVRAMWRRQGILAQVEALFPARVAFDSPDLVSGEEAAPLANVILGNDQAKAPGVALVTRHRLEVPNGVDPDDLLLAEVACDGRTSRLACAAISPGRSAAQRGHIFKEHANNLAAASSDGADDDEVIRQVQRMIKDLRTADYVCYGF